MKITNIEVFVHFSVWRNLILIKMDTDEGITGCGEATIKNKEMAVVSTIEHHIAPYLIGQDPHTAANVFNRFFTSDGWRGGAVYLTAISGIEMALWDIIGKAAGQPVYNLLGGKVRDKLRAYANRWFDGCKTSTEYAAAAKDTCDKLGFTALKWDPLKIKPNYIREQEMVDTAIENVYEVRETVGKNVDLCIELHGQLSYDGAVRFAQAVADANVIFIEEPMHPDDIDGFLRLSEKSKIPIAAGERVLTRFAYKELLRKRCHSIVQMDLSHMGGLLESKYTASMADAVGIKVAPHNSSGVVATMASAMLDATLPNFLMQEMLVEVLTVNEKIMKEKMCLKDGYIHLLDKPGLGVEPDWDAVREVGYISAFNERPR